MKTRIDIYCQNPRNNAHEYFGSKREGLERLREMRGWSASCVLCTDINEQQADGHTEPETEIAHTGNGRKRLVLTDKVRR